MANRSSMLALRTPRTVSRKWKSISVFWKDPDAGKDRRQEKWVTENKMFGQHHRLNRHESEQTPGNSEEQGSLALQSMGRKELDTTYQPNNNKVPLASQILGHPGLVAKFVPLMGGIASIYWALQKSHSMCSIADCRLVNM